MLNVRRKKDKGEKRERKREIQWMKMEIYLMLLIICYYYNHQSLLWCGTENNGKKKRKIKFVLILTTSITLSFLLASIKCDIEIGSICSSRRCVVRDS